MELVEFILYVSNQQQSRDFYAALLNQEPVLDVPGMTKFMLYDNVKLGLMPEEGIARILGDKTKHPSSGNGIPRNEIYLKCEDPGVYFDRAVHCGAVVVSPIEGRTWGDDVGYVSDPDGHILAFARSTTKVK